MEVFVVVVSLVFIGALLYCAYDAVRHADKMLPPKSN
jgi:hypothetical protein